MNMTNKHAKVEVPAQGTVSLHDGVNRRVTCLSGLVWLTMEDDQRDVVLSSFIIDRAGLALLTAQQPSTIEVSAQPEPARGIWGRTMHFLNTTWGPAALRPARKWVY
jgi:Protein of unknown function (DUF2917)